MVMMSRPHMPFFTNSHAIRQEIQRFESVHPSIYAIYDLIELVQDPTLAQQVREHVVCIEDSFVNSQEWTLSRSVPDLRLGIVGSLSSGKSALVHRYLTGSYMQEESPEGGRFKKEVSLDGQSYLLLIRDEGGPPELQFSAWVDAVVFVFSLENESSFNAIYHYYSKMNFFRNTADVPIILVGTQDAISETNPRIIDEGRARKLASELKRCTYFETCATYGLNVEAVFQVACQKVLQQRLALSPAAGGTSSRPSTPSHLGRYQSAGAFLGATSCSTASSCSTNGHMGPPPPPALSSSSSSGPAANCSSVALADSPTSSSSPGGGGSQVAPPISAGGSQRAHQQHATPVRDVTLRHFHSMSAPPLDLNMPPPACVPAGPASASAVLPASSAPTGVVRSDSMRVLPSIAAVEDCQRHQQPPTPGSTPTSTRKSRRRSNLFAPSRKAASAIEDERRAKNGELGVGRAIPVKQGYLYKRSQKALNRDWKKKYVTIHDDGRLVYHSSLHEYMEDAPGKEICLQYTTVKVPGQKPRGSRTITTPAVVNVANNNNNLADNLVALSITSSASLPGHVRSAKESVMLTAYEVLRDTAVAPLATPDDTSLHPQSSAAHNGGGATITADTPSVKKRHRRPKGAQGRTAGGAGGADSGGGDQDAADVSDVFEFCIVSLDNKTWHFEAGSHEERDVWVSIIEQQILSSLQSNESSKSKSRLNSAHDTAALQSIKHSVPGNTHCVDCGAPNPDWASLNLGSLMCIECGGVHRNLGSHISRVRSLDLDEWPPGHLAVMRALGNALANSIWEAHIPAGRVKPSAGSSREEKERWIRAKYEQREFLQPPPGGSSVEQQLVEAVCRADARAVTLALAHSTDVTVNTPVSPRDPRVPLHLAAGLANLPVVQLLIWRGADVRRTDGEGRGAITFARSAGPPGLPVVDLLLSAGAPDVANPTSVNPAAAASIASRRRASMNPRELASII